MAKKKLPKIRLQVEGEPTSGDRYWIAAISEEKESYGDKIGSIELYGSRNVQRRCGKDWAGIDAVANAFVDFCYQRRGVATFLYDEAARLSGCELVPWQIVDGGEELMSADAKAFWESRGGYEFEEDD